ncbi:MAG: hypothetical protein WBP10_01235 [Thermoanaerobaculia bacterium]|jgi:hypothetical protein
MQFRRYLLVSILAPTSVVLFAAEGAEILQPANNKQGLILATEQSRATIEQPGGRRKQLRLRSQEHLTDFVETRSGWAAAGTRAASNKQSIMVLEQSSAGLQRLPDPPSQTELLRAQPRLMVTADEIGGLAWLEGSHPGSLSIRTAAWNGTDWQPVEIVSPPLKGSQTGLSGTVLADGSWLLVWAAYDGHDDEIFWSQKKASRWSAPRRLAPNNLWPDITPKVVATKTGALVAWSRNDGDDYRMTISKFDGSKWYAPQTVGGRGAVDPQLTILDRKIYLLFNSASTASWSILELQPTGRVLRQASVAGPGDERPILTWTSSHQVGLRFASVRETTAQWGANR